MVAEKWQLIEENQMPNGRTMLMLLVGTFEKEDVYEYMYKDVYENIINKTYEYNVFTKTMPRVCVFYQDHIIPHNESVNNIKEEAKKELAMIPAKIILGCAHNDKPTGMEHAASLLLDNKYNVDFIRLCIKEMVAEAAKEN